MADKFDVYNGSETVAHTEGTADSDGYTPITVSSLAPATTYDDFKVAHTGEDISKATAVPSFTTSAINVTGVTMDPANASSVAVGSDITLAALVAPSNATDKGLVWSSSDETIATVDQNGKVTGVKVGNADITAKAHGDQTKTAKATIEVTAAG